MQEVVNIMLISDSLVFFSLFVEALKTTVKKEINYIFPIVYDLLAL
ncbi:MAG: hypothetical protein GXO48_03695 [Chlorobi bacterium]|nr:hypothetical protein [Chlorobiota bacterium]